MDLRRGTPPKAPERASQSPPPGRQSGRYSSTAPSRTYRLDQLAWGEASDSTLRNQRVTDAQNEMLQTSENRSALLLQPETIRSPTFAFNKRRCLCFLITWGIVAAVILAWWVCTLVLRPLGYGWIAQTVLCWLALLLIASRFIPFNKFTPGALVRHWNVLLRRPWFRIPYYFRLGIGWALLLALLLGSVFGFEHQNESTSNNHTRAVALLGISLFQIGLWATSEQRSKIQWPNIITGLFLQQLIAIFVLKTRAGFDIFAWIISLVADFFGFTLAGKVFVWDAEIASKQWFIINIITAVFFFMAFVEFLYHVGVMEWILKKLAWVFFNVMNISGAEAVVAAASPVVGQGDAACLVKPYMNLMTRSELHLVLTSGYSTISGTFVAAYIALGIPAQNLITSSVMSIPAAIAVSKMRCPETDEPVTRGNVVLDRGEVADKPSNAIQAFFKGAAFGLMIAAQIIANTLVFLSLLSLVNSLLTWVGRGVGLEQLTLQLVLGYIFYPLAFLIGIPRHELLPVARLLATKLVANELVAYTDLQALMKTDAALSQRAYTITTYALCGFANLSSLSVVGVLGTLAPSKGTLVARIAFSALVCGFLTTMQTAAIAGMLV